MYIDGLEKIEYDSGKEPKKRKIKIDWLKILGAIIFIIGLVLTGLCIYLEIAEVRAQIAEFGFYKTDISISAIRYYCIPICGISGVLAILLGICLFIKY